MNASPTFGEQAVRIEKMLASGPIIRAVNFHNTSRARAGQYDRELAHYSQVFSSVNEEELDEYLTTGRWRKPKPGLIIAVYEGYRNGYDVFAPLLERHGLIGWFFIITGFLNTAVGKQLAYAQSHEIDMETHEYPDGRYALTWEQVRELDRKHVIASHARSHTELATLDTATVEREVVGSQEDFEKHLGHKVRAFASLTGPPYGENPASDRLIAAAGYDFVFSNFKIQRLHAKKP